SAFATESNIVLAGFEERLMKDPLTYDNIVLSALADYAPATDAEGEAVIGVLERLWAAGSGQPDALFTSAVLTFARHRLAARHRVLALLADTVATGSDRAREDVAFSVVATRQDPEFRRALFATIAAVDDVDARLTLARTLAAVCQRTSSGNVDD